MSLYDRISHLYDEIFPVSPAAVEAIESLIPPEAEKRILDLGAATGGHARAFADRGWDTLGIELSGEMAVIAAARAHVLKGSMLDAESIVKSDYGIAVRFGAALCLGNTLPHLSPESIPHFFSMIRRLLGPGAPFILQTLNYAHPDIGPGFTFPDIQTERFRFERHYESGKAPGTIAFVTTLTEGNRSTSDTTLLHAIKPDMIAYWLRGAGFRKIEMWSGWDQATFDVHRDRYVVTVAR
ncbi:MAG: class I SAM-dependent methyltransferase [Spirochaetales bacterium]|jgi:cyclopropane fatty-acyl-phospholipid synthase-like methyltransferase